MFINWKNFLWGFIIVSSHVKGEWHREVFYEEVSQFRKSPNAYQEQHKDVVIRCTYPMGVSYPPLQISEALENSSYFQSWTLSTHDCPISHETCYLYCHMFGESCSYIDRIGWYLQNTEYHNILEILIKGPKNPYNLFYYFLGSEPHCNHILNPFINSMGATFSHTDKNVFVVDFAYIQP